MKVVRTTLSLAAAGAVAAAMFTAPAQAADDAKLAHNGYAQKNCTAMTQVVRSNGDLMWQDFAGHFEGIGSGGATRGKVKRLGFQAKSVTWESAPLSEWYGEGTWFVLSKGGAISRTSVQWGSDKAVTKTVARGYRFLDQIETAGEYVFATTNKGALVRWDLKLTDEREGRGDGDAYHEYTIDWSSKKILANSGFKGTKAIKVIGGYDKKARVLTLTKMGSLLSHDMKGDTLGNRKVIANKRLAGYTGIGSARCKPDGWAVNSLVLTHKNGHAYIWRDKTPTKWGLGPDGFGYEGQIARWWNTAAVGS